MGAFDQTDPNPSADAIRARYAIGQTLPDPLPADPAGLVRAWFDEAHKLRVQPNPNAIALATSDAAGILSCRIVLCKHLREREGYLVFFTNYQSRKGQALDAHPRAAAVMHWDALDRQIRFEGPVVRSPAAESDAYFATRSAESRLGAWSSDQSRPVDSRDALLKKVEATAARLGYTPETLASGDGPEIPRPPHWGGYRLWAERIEVWVGGPGRVHDRAAWTRSLTPGTGEAEFAGTPWTSTRLQP